MEIKRATPQEMHDLACELLTDALTHLGRVDDTEDPD